MLIRRGCGVARRQVVERQIGASIRNFFEDE
jgi:hypothetical protein